jgi:cytochrome c-type biogenesis protein CcmH
MRLPIRLFAFTILLLASLGPAFAVLPDEKLADPVLEQRARLLSKELRCLVCQNQSIDDSDADLARDLRIIVRERLAAGDSDEEVLDFIVARYGEFALLKPRVSKATWILWLTPPLLLLAGGIGAYIAWHRRRTLVETPLSEEEKAALAKLVE